MRRLFPDFIKGQGAIGLLLARLVMGAAFILHGLPKMQNPYGWMEGMGTSVPPIFQALAALIEVGGGALLLLGFLTPFAAFGLACQMLAALFIAHFPAGHAFVATGQPSFELPLVYLAMSFAFLTLGPGSLSLDYALFGRTPLPATVVKVEETPDIEKRAA